MCAARLPGSGPARRIVSPGPLLAASPAAGCVVDTQVRVTAEPGDALAPRSPPEQCRRYHVETQLLLEAKV